MAKTKKTTKKGKSMGGGKPRSQTRAKTSSRMQGNLDSAARDYADLLRDPCNAKLTRSIWPGSEGAFVSRFETDFIVFNGATEVAGLLVWVPNANTVYQNNVVLTSDTLATQLLLQTLKAPGDAWLAANAGAYRCVAACMQVSYPGTELNRSGIIGIGVQRGSSLAQNIAVGSGGQGINTSASAMRSLCQHAERMPGTMVEATWFPGPGDARDMSTIGQSAAEEVSELLPMNAITMSASGFPVSTGVRVRLVGVYEWTPVSGSGFVSSVATPRSSVSLNEVLMSLPRGDSSWFINAFQKAKPYMQMAGSVINYGMKRLGPAMLGM